ncbi:DotH/IcmK family type IV secretion protein [Acinetobacter indicus]|uniref:DotH/IcmK family type IV secretion protein n=1 Tax=Acinetobacter TaxID=469 RepID=UPI0015D387E3|nr:MULTISPECIES: DotH/IcmK family type IV secretion protein [Acinetobacter]MCP0918066.1 DotH/IcmK family type IV secretion protein [Acinetobacter indicus]
MFKKLLLSSLVVLTAATANAEEPKNTFESSQQLINAPGSSFDTTVEIDRKVQEISKLQLTPEQVRMLKQFIIDQQRHVASPYPTTAKPVTRSIGLSLNPGEAPPALRLSSGMLTSIVFTDNAGQPWNIEKISLNRALFNDGVSNSMKEDDVTETNVLSLEPLTPVAYGNVAITLKGLTTPIIFLLTTGQNDVDFRVDAKVPGISPDTKYSGFSGYSASRISTTIDDMALMFVDGVPPAEAIEQQTKNPDVKAWVYGEDVIIRTMNQVIYPAYRTSVRASNGMTVYKFDGDVRNITLSKEGKPVTIFVEQP